MYDDVLEYIATTDEELVETMVTDYKTKYNSEQKKMCIEITRDDLLNEKLMIEFYQKYNLTIGSVEMFFYGLRTMDGEVLAVCRLIYGDKPEYVEMMKERFKDKVDEKILNDFFDIMGSCAKRYRKSLRFNEEVQNVTKE